MMGPGLVEGVEGGKLRDCWTLEGDLTVQQVRRREWGCFGGAEPGGQGEEQQRGRLWDRWTLEGDLTVQQVWAEWGGLHR